MASILEKINQASSIIHRRIRDQGLATTLVWLYGRGLPALTGVPILRFSKVTPQLYVGPQFRKPGKAFLLRNGINAVINMRMEVDDAERGLTLEHYCYLPTVDDQAPSLEHLNQGVDFIQKVTAQGSKVYIHCGAGVGRAPTMAAAYLISTGMSVEEALNTIRKVRPFIYIMPPQLEQLHQYAALRCGDSGPNCS